MYTVTVDGESKEWFSMELAMADCFSRGFGANEWSLSFVKSA